jgi:hypothetical protein
MAVGKRNLIVNVENGVLTTTICLVPIFTMLSFMLRRTLLRPVIISAAQRLPMRSVLSNQCLALIVQRNLATTSNDRDSESTTGSEPARKSKRKSTRTETGSSAKTSGKGKGKRAAKRGAKKAETKKKKSMSRSVPCNSHTRIECS